MGDTGGLETEDTAVQDFLQILEEHRKNCERQGKYVEAEIAKNRHRPLDTTTHPTPEYASPPPNPPEPAAPMGSKRHRS